VIGFQPTVVRRARYSSNRCKPALDAAPHRIGRAGQASSREKALSCLAAPIIAGISSRPIPLNKRSQQYAPWFAFGASCFFDE
jgi:hypothetical protein